MRIIALQGKSNSGKTTTLKLLIDLMSEKYNVIEKSNNRGFDCWVKFKVSDKIVAIGTAGDLDSIIENALSAIGSCDIFVCAVHSYGKTVECLYKHAKKEDIHIYGRFTYENNGSNLEETQKEQKNVNLYQVKYLMEQISKLLD